MPELLFLRLGKTDEIEYFLLKSRIVNTDTAPAELKAVEHEIVLQAAYLTGVGIQQTLVFGSRRGEHVMRRCPRVPCAVKAIFFILTHEQRKIDDPGKRQLARIALVLAQIRLIGSVLLHHVVIVQARPGCFLNSFFREQFRNKLRKHVLDQKQNIVLRYKRHLNINLVKLARASVRASIFIAETRRDLKIPFKAGNHQKLLVLLRALRQREKFTFMQTRRHQIIARTLGRGFRKYRRMNFHESFLVQMLPNMVHDTITYPNVL